MSAEILAITGAAAVGIFVWFAIGGYVAGIAEGETDTWLTFDWYWAWILWPFVYAWIFQDRAKRRAKRRLELEKATHEAALKAQAMAVLAAWAAEFKA